MKQNIAKLKEDVDAAKANQKEAQEECKKLESDMKDFKNNKDGKISELKVWALSLGIDSSDMRLVERNQQEEI